MVPVRPALVCLLDVEEAMRLVVIVLYGIVDVPDQQPAGPRLGRVVADVLTILDQEVLVPAGGTLDGEPVDDGVVLHRSDRLGEEPARDFNRSRPAQLD